MLDLHRLHSSHLETIQEVSQCSSEDYRLSSFSFTDNSKQRFSETLMYSDTLDPPIEEEEEDQVTASRYDGDELPRTTTLVDKPFIEGRTDVQLSDISEVFLPQENEDSADTSNSDSNLSSSSSVADILALDMVILGRLFCTLWREPHQLIHIFKEDYSILSDKIAYQPKHNSQTSENLKSGLTVALLEDSRTSSDRPPLEINTMNHSSTNYVDAGVLEDEVKRLQDVTDLMEQEMAELEDINYTLSAKIVELKNELKRVSFEKEVLLEQNRLLSSAVVRGGA